MKTLVSTIVILGSFYFSPSAVAQKPSELPNCKKRLELIRTSSGTERDIAISEALKFQNNSTCFAQVLLQKHEAQALGFAKFFQDLEARRTDKQAGSSTASGGATNLVAKGLTARAISVAAEYGALTESVNKQVVTVAGSLGGFAAALARQKLVEYCPGGDGKQGCLSQPALDFLRRISYAISFDTNQGTDTVSGTATATPQGAAQRVILQLRPEGSTPLASGTPSTAQPVTFTANRRQISAWTGRFILWNKRDAVSDAFKSKWASVLQSDSTSSGSDQVKAAGAELLKSFQAFMNGIKFDQAVYDDAFRAAFADLKSTQTDLDARWNKWVDDVVSMIEDKNPGIVSTVVEFLRARQAYVLAEDDLVSAIADKPVLTFEYNNNRPVGQDPTSTFRLIFDKGLGSKWALTANGAFTLFDTRPQVPNVDRLRDAQLGVQVQRDLGTVSFLGAAALSGAYYFQYQNSPAILNVTPGTPLPGITFTGLPATATKVFAEKGNLHLGQIRLVLGPGKSSVRFPVAVSYSNRTELIAKPTWRAQVGISYDFDSLFAK